MSEDTSGFKKPTSEEEEELKKALFLNVLNSPEELQDWVTTYIGVKLPSDTIDPDSNSNPIQAMWEIYEAVKLNKGDEIPGYIMLSAREGFKTLSASILEILILTHFQLSIAHMAAISSQSNKAISYIQSFLVRLKPYYDHHNWSKIGDSKSKIQFQTPQGNSPYIAVIICSLQGANSEHVPIMFLDEIDVVRDPQAYNEARLIPGMERGTYPITVKLSTRKFAFGLMEEELQNAKTTGEIVKRWNILDVTEKCPQEKHQAEEGVRHPIWVSKKLPLQSMTDEQIGSIDDSKKSDWERVQVHKGCLKCPLVSVCKSKLADKPVSAEASKISLYKPIKSVINTFKKTPADMAEAQLMCWRPSTKGLIYPRFEPTHNTGNLVTINKAYELISGEKSTTDMTLDDFVTYLHSIDTRFYAGVDWGFTHESTIVIIAVTGSGYSFIIETYGESGLETHDFVEVAAKYQARFAIHRWYCDQSAPGSIKTLKKKIKEVHINVQVPEFKKDVMAGIESIRGQIITSSGVRKLLVLDTPENQKIITGFKVHHFKLDMAGNPTITPDDEDYADVMDSLRYVGQNIFAVTGGTKPVIGANPDPMKKINTALAANPQEVYVASGVNTELMRNEISSRVTEPSGHIDDTNKKKRKIVWNAE